MNFASSTSFIKLKSREIVQLVARIRRHSASSAQVMATAESQQSTAEVLTPHNEADVASIEVGQSTQQQADATDESVVATTETGGRI
eukprot:SAG31_NODE_81_length_27131_cov_4.775283_14_plen_87_part_00